MDIKQPNDSELKEILSHTPQAIFESTLGEVKPAREKINELVESLLKKGCYYLIAAEENNLMRWILLGTSKDQFTDQTYGFIYELYVIEEHRGKGISKKLMNAATDLLKKKGYPEVRLNAYKGNQAIQIYESMGFNTKMVTMGLSL